MADDRAKGMFKYHMMLQGEGVCSNHQTTITWDKGAFHVFIVTLKIILISLFPLQLCTNQPFCICIYLCQVEITQNY